MVFGLRRRHGFQGQRCLVRSARGLRAIAVWTTIRLRPAFARTLDEDRTLRVRAPLRLDMQNSSQGVGATARRRAGAIARRPPPKPRGGPSALAGERSDCLLG